MYYIFIATLAFLYSFVSSCLTISTKSHALMLQRSRGNATEIYWQKTEVDPTDWSLRKYSF
jgi:hypothetical protein